MGMCAVYLLMVRYTLIRPSMKNLIPWLSWEEWIKQSFKRPYKQSSLLKKILVLHEWMDTHRVNKHMCFIQFVKTTLSFIINLRKLCEENRI